MENKIYNNKKCAEHIYGYTCIFEESVRNCLKTGCESCAGILDWTKRLKSIARMRYDYEKEILIIIDFYEKFNKRCSFGLLDSASFEFEDVNNSYSNQKRRIAFIKMLDAYLRLTSLIEYEIEQLSDVDIKIY